MRLNEVVPWGRSFAEYKLLFDLSESDLDKKILGCGDGPASFNSEMTAAGHQVVSFDPIYAFSASEIRQRIEETRDTIVAQVQQNPQRYVWDYFANPEALGQARLRVMRDFLSDFESDLAARRYLPASLPTLPFTDGQFDLALCSHLLFLYSEQLSLDFHLASIQELLRAATEVRIFPLLGLDCQPSPYLEAVQTHFSSQSYIVDVRAVPYEFQRGGNQMMVLSSSPS